MNILIAGASGFIGQNLVAALQNKHSITVVGRDKTKLEQLFTPPIKINTWDSLTQVNANNFDAIINLCGYNISASRWTDQVKKELIESRVKTSSNLIGWVKKHSAKPHFYCANAVGIYGLQENGDPHIFDEDSPINFEQPKDFMSEIGIRWQQALQPAIDYGMKVTTTRFGVVLKKGEGMLKKLAPSFYCGLGAIVGDGKQVISWVHIDDLVGAYLFLLQNSNLTGAFNVTAPQPISQAEFAQTLATAMNRPLFLKIPAAVIRVLFGEMGESLLLSGQRVMPKRLMDVGYRFNYPELERALKQCWNPSS